MPSFGAQVKIPLARVDFAQPFLIAGTTRSSLSPVHSMDKAPFKLELDGNVVVAYSVKDNKTFIIPLANIRFMVVDDTAVPAPKK